MGGGRLECSNENIEKRGVQGYKPFYSQWSRHVCSQGASWSSREVSDGGENTLIDFEGGYKNRLVL